MTENEKREFLDVARAMVVTGDVENGCAHYYKVFEADSENAEAEFFADYLGYLNLIEQADGPSAARAFSAMSDCVAKAVKWVKASEGEDMEKYLVVEKMVKSFTPITRFLYTKRLSTTKTTIEGGVLTLYKLGNVIKDEFGTAPEIQQLILEPWKEAVALQRQFYGFKYNDVKPEDYAAEIQKFDPSYTIPKKAGCVSVG